MSSLLLVVVVQSLICVWLLPGSSVLHCLLEFSQTHARWVGDAIQPSHPLLPPSPPALNLSQHQSFLMSWLFASGGQSIGPLASASVLPVNIHGWFPLGWIGLISLLSRGLSEESSPAPQSKSIISLLLSLLYGPALISVHDWVAAPSLSLSVWAPAPELSGCQIPHLHPPPTHPGKTVGTRGCPVASCAQGSRELPFAGGKPQCTADKGPALPASACHQALCPVGPSSRGRAGVSSSPWEPLAQKLRPRHWRCYSSWTPSSPDFPGPPSWVLSQDTLPQLQAPLGKGHCGGPRPYPSLLLIPGWAPGEKRRPGREEEGDRQGGTWAGGSGQVPASSRGGFQPVSRVDTRLQGGAREARTRPPPALLFFEPFDLEPSVPPPALLSSSVNVAPPLLWDWRNTAPWVVTGTRPALRRVAPGKSWLLTKLIATEVTACPRVGGAGHLLTTKGHIWVHFLPFWGCLAMFGYFPKIPNDKTEWLTLWALFPASGIKSRFCFRRNYGSNFGQKNRDLFCYFSFPGGASKEPACQCRRHKRLGSVPGSGRSPKGGHGNPRP